MCEITEKKVSEKLRRLGVPVSMFGFTYIKTSILLIAEDEDYLHSITKRLYPTIAKQYNTTTSRAERNIRHAIEKMYLDGDINEIESLGAASIRKGNMTNREFLGALYESLKFDDEDE